MTPSIWQLTMLTAAMVLLGAGVMATLPSWGPMTRRRRLTSCLLYYAGGMGLAGVLLIHSRARWMLSGSWLPMEDNFDAIIWLSLLLLGFVAYVQHVRPIGGLEWFLIPLVLGLLGAAMIFGPARPHDYVRTTWSMVHRGASFLGAASFAVAATAGGMYLLAHFRLKRKRLPAHSPLASLERLENVCRHASILGFALLSVGLVSGVIRLLDRGGATSLGARWFYSPKIWLSVGVWVVFALLLHPPLLPRLRGPRAAMLSLLGFALMLALLLAMEFMPGGAR